MGYGDDLGFVNALLIHQTNRQKIIEGGITPHLTELYWFANKVQANVNEDTMILQSAYLLAKWRMLSAKQKIQQLSAKMDDMTLLEKRALLTEAYAQLEQAEELLNG